MSLKENIKLVTLNTQSLKSKSATAWNYFTDLNIDLAVLTETWLKSEDESWVAGCDLNVNQFRMQTLNRSNKKGGGLAIVYKHTY